MSEEWSTDDIIGASDYDGETVGVSYEGIEYVTNLAAKIIIDGEKFWVPKSVIVDADDETVIVKSWWAEKEGLESF